MKKLLALIAALSMFAVACSTETTIDLGQAETEASTGNAEASVGDADSDAADEDDAAETRSAPEAEVEVEAPEVEVDAEVEVETPEVEVEVEVDAEVETEEEPEPEAAPESTVESEDDTTSAVAGAVDADADAALRAVTSADDWCVAANAVEGSFEVLDTLAFADPELLERQFTQVLAVLVASERLVPNEIAVDLDQTIETFTALVSALEEVEWVFFELDLGILNEFEGPMDTATFNIETYNFTECGIGADPAIDDEDSEEDSDDLPEFTGTIRDQAVLGLVEAGFTDAEANCIFDNLDFADPEALADPAVMFAVFGDCEIPIERLAELGG